MRRGGARGGRAARGGLCAAVLLGMAASAAWAQSPERCSEANLSVLFSQAFEACEASGGLASSACCFAVSRFSANPPTSGCFPDPVTGEIKCRSPGDGKNCLCFQDVYDRLKAFVRDRDIKTFVIDDIERGCRADFGVKVGTPKNRCNADEPDPVPDPVPAPEFMSCAGMRKKACRRTTGGKCFFFRKVCRPTLQNGADPSECSLLRRPKACRAAGCTFTGRKKRGTCAAPPTAASRSLGNP